MTVFGLFLNSIKLEELFLDAASFSHVNAKTKFLQIESSLIKIQKRVNLKFMKTFEINQSPK